MWSARSFPKLAHGNAAELLIDERQQLIEGSPAAATPVNEQRRDVACRGQERPPVI